MDLYIPYKTFIEKQEVFLIVHGGGLRGGDKFQLTFYTLLMMQWFSDYVLGNINYRLASEKKYGIPNEMDDIKSY